MSTSLLDIIFHRHLVCGRTISVPEYNLSGEIVFSLQESEVDKEFIGVIVGIERDKVTEEITKVFNEADFEGMKKYIEVNKNNQDNVPTLNSELRYFCFTPDVVKYEG